MTDRRDRSDTTAGDGWPHLTDRQFRLALLGLAIFAAVVVFIIASTVFPHHSSNHDEAVYLQQADLLLDGQFWFTSATPEAVQPWFFVRDGSRLYPKYTPVPAAIFAVGVAVGIPRLSLALVAAVNVALTGLVVREAFDRRTGLLASGLVLGSPLFLLESSVFLPYAPTTALNLLFALGYLRSWRATDTGRRRRYAAVTGVAIGLAFFARPLTAILFAAPFVCHSTLALGTTVVRWWRTRRGSKTPAAEADSEADESGDAEADHSAGSESRDSTSDRAVLERAGIVAALGLVGVLVALGYNRLLTGDPLVFPYQAFAPLDGPGFGYRRILGYDRVYTPALALRANAIVLWRLCTRWTTAAPLGTLAAGIGLVAFLARVRADYFIPGRLRDGIPDPRALGETGRRALLAGLFLSVPMGNVFFWGNLNILAALDDPTDGLISQFGPFYHFDLVLPLAAFGAAGIVAVARVLDRTTRDRLQPRGRRAVIAVAVVSVLVVAGVAQAGALGAPIDRTRPYTERYERAYAPFEDREFDRALVFLPTPYGDWLNHPFQSLRNGPDLGGSAVYALDLNASSNFAVLDTYPNRTLYRYDFRGEWEPAIDGDEPPIRPQLRRIRRLGGQRHRVATTVGRVEGAESVSIRLAAGEESVLYGVDRLPPERLTVNWLVEDGSARLVGGNLRQYSDEQAVSFEGTAELVLTVTFTQPGGSTVTYRQAVSVRERDGGVAVVWPPETQVCRLVTECGTEGTYVRGADDYVEGVSVTDRIQTVGPLDGPGAQSD